MSLCKVVDIDQKKCLNCHVCISVCPVPYCLSDDKTVKINHDLCIGCGRCYKACPHKAISIVDDFEIFLDSINSAKKVILIVSPAYMMNYKNNSKNFIGWLKKNFILEGVFDESFGAEILALLLNGYIKKSKKLPLITQQCPTIVEYIKIYKPFLVTHLAPFQSPTVITAKFIRKILNYKGIIAYLGSCLSKRREFTDPFTDNAIQMNITLEKISNYINQNNIDINNFPESEFDFIPSEKAVFFTKPGGIVNITNKNNTYKMLNFEGVDNYKNHISNLSENIENSSNHEITLVDMLNCEEGCQHGPGIVNSLDIFDEKTFIDKAENESISNFIKEYKNQKIYEKILTENKEIKLDRKYSFVNQDVIFTLSDEELKNIYSNLNKKENKDFLNCRSCGFTSCREFATSCFFKLNNSSNCRVFLENKFNIDIHNAMLTIEELSIKTKNLFNSSASVNQYLSAANNLFEVLKSIIDNIISYNYKLNENTEKFRPIITAISEVSEQINLLSFNASIEASRTGEFGKGFTVVAGEIRSLADKTKDEIDKINPILEVILNSSNGIINISSSLGDQTNDISTNLDQLSHLITDITKNINILYNSLK